MKITDVRPVLTSAGFRNLVFVVVDTDEGISGVGEAGITMHGEAVAGCINTLRNWLIGQDATRIEHLWQLMFRGGFFSGGNILSAAVSAIDIALWDLNAKALNVPLYRLLGGLVREKVPTYCHIGGHSLAGVVESAQQAVAEGWRCVRWGAPQQEKRHEPSVVIRESIAGMEALRAKLGPDVELCFDIHARLDPSDAIALSRGIEATRPFFIEDPIRSENIQLYRHLRAHINSPLAAGEHYASKWEVRQFIEEDLIDFARLDLCIVGGLSEAKKIAGWCETHQIRLVTHNPLGPVCAAASLHLNLAITNCGVAEQIRRPGSTLTDLFPVQIGWEDGFLLPTDRPGLGIVFDEAAAKASPFRRDLPPHYLLRDDGALTNW